MGERQKRNIVKRKEEIRKIIEDSGMRYVLLPNGIFDELYMQESIKGIYQAKVKNEETGRNKTVWIEGETQFTELCKFPYYIL